MVENACYPSAVRAVFRHVIWTGWLHKRVATAGALAEIVYDRISDASQAMLLGVEPYMSVRISVPSP